MQVRPHFSEWGLLLSEAIGADFYCASTVRTGKDPGQGVIVGPPTRRSRGDERHGGRRNPQARGDALGVSPALVAAPCIEAGRKMWLLVVAGAASHAGAVRDDEELTQFVGDDGRRKGEQTENGAGYEHGEDEQ